MAATSPSLDELAHDRGHPRLAQHRVGPPRDARRRRRAPRASSSLTASATRSPPRSGSARTRSSGTDSPASVAGADREEEVGRELVGRGRERRFVVAAACRATASAPELTSGRADGSPSAANPGAPRRRRAGRRGGRGAWRSSSRSRTAGDRAVGERADAVERGDGRRPADAVGREAGVALELDERAAACRAPKMPSPAAGVEPERVQPALELGDVVAAQHRLAEVEQPVAEGEPALDERGPGLRGRQIAVDPRARGRCLERAHGARRWRRRRRPGSSAGRAVAERAEPPLEVADGLAARARSEQRGRGSGSGQRRGARGPRAQATNSARSWRSCPLPLAPTSRLTWRVAGAGTRAASGCSSR